MSSNGARLRRLILAGLLSAAAAAAEHWTLYYPFRAPQAAFAASEIRQAALVRGHTLSELPLEALSGAAAGRRLVIASGGEDSQRVASLLRVKGMASRAPQSYSVRGAGSSGQRAIAILAAEPNGAMYGGLDLAEAIRLGAIETLGDSDHAPYIERRGIKFNAPLDVRTPSYSDNSHAAQLNIPEMWSFDFWREFLDHMARHRFNLLSLWSLHPFPSLVRVPEYPEVALDDVLRTTYRMDETYSGSGRDMVRPELLANTETVKKMTIGEKIAFWREVMRYAEDRGISVYWFTWNIFTFGAEGKHGITTDQTSPKTIDYFRASVRELVLTYPLLAGIGITSGENMENRNDEFSKEKWLWKTYGEGILDAKKLQPNRKVHLIHRYHQTAQSEILNEWKRYPDPFDFSFKYSIAHMYSIPNPPFIHEALPHLKPPLRTFLTVRDDDYYSFRWGDPAYARAYIRHMPGPDKMAGFYMGPDGTIWGREFLSREPETPRELVIAKRWYSFMLWGRLSYNPDLPDSLFERALASRFPEVDSAVLSRAWAAASRIFPRITSFFWGDIDVRWFPEACLSHPRHRGFYTVRHFIEGESMPGSGVLNIIEWRSRRRAGQPMNATSPPEVADTLESLSRTTLELAAQLRPRQGSNKELRLTLGDLEAMAHLGNYYAAKIRGAAELALFDLAAEEAARQRAVRHLETAVGHWRLYAKAYTAQYEQPKLYNRVGWVDIPGLVLKVENDVQMARQWKPGTITAPAGRQADTPFRK